MTIQEQAKMARGQGLKKFESEPCPNGHTQRYSSTGRCVRCQSGERYPKKNLLSAEKKEEARLKSAKYRKDHPDRVRQSLKNWRKKNLKYVPPCRRK